MPLAVGKPVSQHGWPAQLNKPISARILAAESQMTKCAPLTQRTDLELRTVIGFFGQLYVEILLILHTAADGKDAIRPDRIRMEARFTNDYLLSDPMNIATTGQLIIGLTHSGDEFRPSDWVHRIAGIFATFDDNQRLRYSPCIIPTWHEGLPGLYIADDLASSDPVGYQFVMDFATSHQLQLKSFHLGQSGRPPSDSSLSSVA